MRVVFAKDYGDKICLMIDVVPGSVKTETADQDCDRLKKSSDMFGGNIVIGGRGEHDELLGIIALVEKDYEPDEDADDKDLIVYQVLQSLVQQTKG